MNKNYFDIEISFTNIEFDSMLPHAEQIEKVHDAQLFTSLNEIEIKIFYKPKTEFEFKFMSWFTLENKWKELFSNLNAVSKSEWLQKIDFSKSKLVGYNNGDGTKEYFIIKVDTVTLYFEPILDRVNTANFYLNESGCNIVSEYYTPLYNNMDGVFKIDKENNVFYKFGISEFSFEFNFLIDNKTSKTVSIIKKEPKIHFIYNKHITIEKALYYAEIIKNLASFYNSNNVDFVFSCIYLEQNRIEIWKPQKKEKLPLDCGFNELNLYWRFHNFISLVNFEKVEANYKKLLQSVERLIQSHKVDSISRFLIRYSIIEVCMSGGKNNNAKFDFCEIDDAMTKAYECLIKAVKSEDINDFNDKWKTVKDKLSYKPMKSPLLSFLELNKLPVSKFSININKVKEKRDAIIHGSLKDDKSFDMEKANLLLYRISSALILNLLGVTEWSVKADFK